MSEKLDNYVSLFLPLPNEFIFVAVFQFNVLFNNICVCVLCEYKKNIDLLAWIKITIQLTTPVKSTGCHSDPFPYKVGQCSPCFTFGFSLP